MAIRYRDQQGNEVVIPYRISAFSAALDYYSHEYRDIQEFRRIPDLTPDSHLSGGMNSLHRAIMEFEDPEEHKRSFWQTTDVLGDDVMRVGIAAAKDQQFTLEEAKRLWTLYEPLLERKKKEK